MLLFFICGVLKLLNERDAALFLFFPEAINNGMLATETTSPATDQPTPFGGEAKKFSTPIATPAIIMTVPLSNKIKATVFWFLQQGIG